MVDHDEAPYGFIALKAPYCQFIGSVTCHGCTKFENMQTECVYHKCDAIYRKDNTDVILIEKPTTYMEF